MSRTTLLALLALPLLSLSGTVAFAQAQGLTPRMSGAELIARLKQGGTVVLMRHMATDPGDKDPELLDLSDCTTQRNLNERGRAQARKLGEAFQKLSIPVGKVLSSPYCRCMETGTLAFGEVEKSELLSIGRGLESQEKIEGGGEVRKLLDVTPAEGASTILITHTVNLLYTFGLEPKPEGVAHVFRPTGLGIATYLGKIVPDDWTTAVEQAAANP